MRQSNQDFTARTSYDIILPLDARQEMLKPKRPAILRRPLYRYPAPERSGILKWAGAFALCAIILAGVIGHYSQSVNAPATPQHATPIVQPTPIPAQPVSQPQVPPPPAVSAPRARLVLYKRWAGNGVWEITDSTGRTLKILIDPAPRAQLVRLPTWQPGAELRMRIPYDESFEVRGVFRGYLASEGLLPRSNNSIGDTWVVGTTPCGVDNYSGDDRSDLG
jgi:hypothetical protein